MKKGWKSYLALLLCLILIGSNSAFVYAAEAENSAGEVVSQMAEESTDEGTTDEETTEEGTAEEGTIEEGTTEEGITEEGTTEEGTTDEGNTEEGTTEEGSTEEGTTEEGSTEEGATEEESTDEGATEEGTTEEGSTEDGSTEEPETTLPDGNPVIAADMPALETLSEVELGKVYSAEYDPENTEQSMMWLKFTPEITGVYKMNSNEEWGDETVLDTEGYRVYTDYSYIDYGLLQYLEAGTTYVLNWEGSYSGNGVLEFSIEKAKEVSALKVTKAPTKTTYYKNFAETLDPTGMKVKVTYTDGTSETVTANDYSAYDLKSGYTLWIEEAWGEDYFEISIGDFDSFPSITYNVKFVNATGLTKYTSGNKISFKAGETVKYLKYVATFTGDYTLEAIGMSNIYASLMDAATGYSVGTLTKGKTYNLRVESYHGIAGTARVYIEKETEDDKKKLKNFEITKLPYQTEFYFQEGEYIELTPAGMEITVTYTDGTTEVLCYEDRAIVESEISGLQFEIDDITYSNPKAKTYELTISVYGYDISDSYEVTLTPLPAVTESTLEEGTTKIACESGKYYYNSYIIPKDGVYVVNQNFGEYYKKESAVYILDSELNYWSGDGELKKGTEIYFYILNYGDETLEGEININRLYDVGATITDFEWTTPPQKETLAYYNLIRGEGTVTFSDGSKVEAGIPAYTPGVEWIEYPININTSSVRDYLTLGEKEITYTIEQNYGDEYSEKGAVKYVGPSTYNGGPRATIKQGQKVTVNAAEINDDYAVYKFVPTKTAAYRMIAGGELGYEGAHEYGVFTEADGKLTVIDNTSVSGYYVDRETLTAGETYYIVFPLKSTDNFTFTCRETKAVKGVSGFISSELQVKGATVKDVLKNATITISFKDGTTEKLDNTKWTYYENEDSKGYYNSDSYYNMYTVSLGKTQGTTKKLTTERQMITVVQEMNYAYTVELGYVKANGYKITFNKNNGTYLSKASKVVAAGTKLGTLPTAKRKGYVLKGWYTAKTGGTKFTASTKIGKSRTLYAQWTKVTKPAKVKKPTLTNLSGKKMKVAYKKVTNAKGYQIVYSTSSKFTSSTTKKATTTSLSKTFTSLKKGKTYYVKVRAYKKDSYGNKIYGSYSTVNKVKITK